MGLRLTLLRLTNWLHNRLNAHGDNYPPRLSEDGLMAQKNSYVVANHTTASGSGEPAPGASSSNAVKAVAIRGRNEPMPDRQEGLEKLQAGFDRLIDELSGINDHLRKQVAQQEELIARVDQLPRLAEGLPAAVESQKLLTEQLISQLKANLLKDQQMLSAVEKIPVETAKQTDALINIDRQLAAATDVDVQMTETFNKFNRALEKLNQSTQDHSEGISQMSRTFAASDRYLKYIVSRQTRQFMWVFYSALAICIVVILVLVGIVIYLSR
jgi:hypothetical protein